MQHGKGKLTDKTGKTIEVYYENGNRVKIQASNIQASKIIKNNQQN